jgi:hypothetical protein
MVNRARIIDTYRGWRVWQPRWMLLCPERHAEVDTWFAVGAWYFRRQAEQARRRLQRELDGAGAGVAAKSG